MVNPKRLLDTFLELVKIGSISREEKEVALYCQKVLQSLAIETFFDTSSKRLLSNCSNLIAKLPGPKTSQPLMLCAHLDTVNPGKCIKPIVEDNIVKSDGTTVLGADDKAGVAIILEVLRVLQEQRLQHPPLEIVFTVCEEIGLLGAKELDYSLITAPHGIVLDGGSITEVIHRAPTANRISIKVHGREAHAGIAPETGLNAIVLASRAIAQLKLGRIDEETTANIGLIKGGVATNIVPNLVEIAGEARSHDPKKLECVTEAICQPFNKIEQEKNNGPIPGVEIGVNLDYPLMRVEEDHPLIQRIFKTGKRIGIEIQLKKGGGGSDANIFNAKGIASVILGTGMSTPHSVNEILKIDDMVMSVTLILELLNQWSESPS
jgi:tripeptide aminopeptidase